MATKTGGGVGTEATRDLSFEERDEFTVSDEVWQKTQARNDDGTVDVGIYDFEVKRRDDREDKVTIRFRTPSLEEKSETMKWPKYPDDSYKLIRVLDQIGLDFTGIEYLRTGEPETIRADPDDWTLVAPEKQSAIERAIERVKDARSNDIVLGVAKTVKLLGFLSSVLGIVLYALVGGSFTGVLVFGGLVTFFMTNLVVQEL